LVINVSEEATKAKSEELSQFTKKIMSRKFLERLLIATICISLSLLIYYEGFIQQLDVIGLLVFIAAGTLILEVGVLFFISYFREVREEVFVAVTGGTAWVFSLVIVVLYILSFYSDVVVATLLTIMVVCFWGLLAIYSAEEK